MRYVKPLALFNDLLAINKTNNNTTKALKQCEGRLLGLDVGCKYVGLAVSDPSFQIASPLSVLERTKTNIDLMAADFQCLVSRLSLVGFVVGCPLDRLRGTPDFVLVKMFIDDLCKTGKLENLKYTYWDESFTSKNVELLLKPLDLHLVQAKTISDKFAAVGILQGYLDYSNRKLKLEAPE